MSSAPDDNEPIFTYCEDYPCCGHTDKDPCPGRGAVITEPWYCDECGIEHNTDVCPYDDYIHSFSLFPEQE